jgi:outer membrane receptor protein involved in Fe transport
MNASRKIAACIALTLAVAASNVHANEAADTQLAFNIHAQPLEQALTQFGATSGLQVLFDSKLPVQKVAPEVVGTLSVQDALKKLLEGSSLRYVFINPKTVAIRSLREAPTGRAAAQGPSIRLARAESGDSEDQPPAGDAGAQPSQSGRAEVLEEILVTAEKRIARLQDVPVPVTAIQASGLVDSNQLRVQDYYTRIPGLSLSLGNRGETFLAVRGLTTGGYANPTVGIVVDDVPYGGSTSYAGGNYAPDIDPNDLARIEVLRGPQGTLYGASSIGGLLNFVTLAPSLEGFSGRVQAGVSSVYDSDEAGYNVRGSANVPLSETFAVRASAFTRRDPGYIDDPVQGRDDINRRDTDGGHVAALWRPSDRFSLKLSALLQDSDSTGASFAFRRPGFGDLEQAALRGSGFYNRKAQVYSLTLAGKAGGIDITSISGYGINEIKDSIDLSAGLSGVAQALFQVGGAPILDSIENHKFTQEIRFAGALGERIEWLAGAFYTDEDTDTTQEIAAADTATGAVVGSLLDLSVPTTFKEYAAFANLTFHINDRFDVQVGGRESRSDQTYSSLQSSIWLGIIPPLAVPEVRERENAFTYLLTPRFKVSEDLMLYARFASGYRPGGPNVIGTAVGLPSEYSSDSTQNYEVGMKGQALEGALAFDASLYYIDWKDIQASITDPNSGVSYFDNASRAASRGVELAVESRPVEGLTLGAWVAWNDATLTEPFPAGSAYGVDGDRLPYSSRWSGNVSLDQQFYLGSALTASVGGSLSYVGERYSYFTSTPQRELLPSYTQADLRAGLSYESWDARLSVNNLTDRRGVLSGGLGSIDMLAFNYIQPRTIALSLSKSF